MFDRFAWTVAFRQLRFGISQTLLTVGVVAVSVTLIVFLTSLIGGLQKRLVAVTTGSIPAIVLSQPEPVALSISDLNAGKPDTLYFVRRSGQDVRQSKIENWQPLVERIRKSDDRITAVSAVAEGQTIVSGASKRQGVRVVGAVPQIHNLVVDIQNKLVEGKFFEINSGELAMGKRMANDFGLVLGDRVSLLAQDGDPVSYRVAGIFQTGFEGVDRRSVFVVLRDAQSLFGLGSAITSLDVKLKEVFAADDVAAGLRLQTPYKIESWMTENKQLLGALEGQSSSSRTIVLFTVMAAGFGIASILITAVVSRMREIGILRAIGATRHQILSVFVIQSAVVSSIGGILGVAMGVGFSLLLYRARLAAAGPAGSDDVFAPDLGWQLVLGSFVLAVVIGLVASAYPARKAARVNPIEVIRGS